MNSNELYYGFFPGEGYDDHTDHFSPYDDDNLISNEPLNEEVELFLTPDTLSMLQDKCGQDVDVSGVQVGILSDNNGERFVNLNTLSFEDWEHVAPVRLLSSGEATWVREEHIEMLSNLTRREAERELNLQNIGWVQV